MADQPKGPIFKKLTSKEGIEEILNSKYVVVELPSGLCQCVLPSKHLPPAATKASDESLVGTTETPTYSISPIWSIVRALKAMEFAYEAKLTAIELQSAGFVENSQRLGELFYLQQRCFEHSIASIDAYHRKRKETP